MNIVIHPDGAARCLYSEEIDLAALGELSIKRASHVEPHGRDSMWYADMAPVGGPVLGPYRARSEALAAENVWLEENRL